MIRTANSPFLNYGRNFANSEYQCRGGTGGPLIGQVAAAILCQLPDIAEQPAEETPRA